MLGTKLKSLIACASLFIGSVAIATTGRSSTIQLRPDSLPEGKRVCVIGAGPSGLISLKSLLDAGLSPLLFERSDSLGGTWVYRRENSEYCQNSCYESLCAITNKYFMEFACFQGKIYLSNFPTWKQLNAYLHLFARHFNLESRIYLQHSVTSVRRGESAPWSVSVRNSLNKHETQHEFDFLVICTGLFTKPIRLSIPGESNYTGVRMHSQQYKHSRQIPRNASVLVIGYGESGQQIARELSSRAFVTVSKDDKRKPDGKDSTKTSSILDDEDSIEAMAGDSNRLIQSRNSLNYSFSPRVQSLDGNRVQFIDGSSREFDYIIECTGYSFEYPFMDIPMPFHHSAASGFDMMTSSIGAGVSLNQRTPLKSWNELYLHVFPVEEKNLAFIGFVTNDSSTGSLHQIMESQAVVASAVFAEQLDLPSEVEMKSEIRKWKGQINYNNPMLVDSDAYMHDLEALLAKRKLSLHVEQSD